MRGGEERRRYRSKSRDRYRHYTKNEDRSSARYHDRHDRSSYDSRSSRPRSRSRERGRNYDNFEIDRKGRGGRDRDVERGPRYGRGRFEESHRVTAFDRMLAERLSPFRGDAVPLEQRIRHLRNWDAPPEGFERISADKAKLTGLFPPPGNIAKTTRFQPVVLDPAKAAMLSMLSSSNVGGGDFATASKQARRVYVGGILPSTTEDELRDFFNETAGSADAVANVQISTDQSYAFVDFKTAEDATNMISLDGLPFQGVVLKLRRPREYTDTPTDILKVISSIDRESNQLLISGLPSELKETHIRALLSCFGDVDELIRLGEEGMAVFSFVDEDPFDWVIAGLDGYMMGEYRLEIRKLLDVADDPEICDQLYKYDVHPSPMTSEPSRIMQLLNIPFNDNVKLEIEKFGAPINILNLGIIQPRILIEYETEEQAKLGLESIAGRYFGNLIVIGSYYPIERYEKELEISHKNTS